MSWYQYKGEATPDLPKRIRLDDGSVRRNLNELSESQLSAVGIVTIANPPVFDEATQEPVWDSNTSTWSVVPTTDEDKIDLRWEEIEIGRHSILVKINKKLSERYSDGSGLTTSFVTVIDSLDNLSKENALSIDIIDQESIGITSSIGISQEEHQLVSEAFSEYAQEIHYKKSYEYESSYCRGMIKKYWGIDCPQRNLSIVPDFVNPDA